MRAWTNAYPINNVVIPWGKTFGEVTPLLSGFGQLPSYPTGWANLHVKGTTIFGLNCPVIEIRAPFPDRPVLQVQYHLAPLSPVATGDLHSAYVQLLTAQLGTPDKQESYYDNTLYKGAYSASAVVFTASWDTADVHLGLSVFGGTRQIHGNDHAATLYLQWKNEVTAAKKLLQEADELVSHFLPLIENAALHKTELAHPQLPFFDFNNQATDPRKPDHAPLLRYARIALYKRNNYPTPVEISRNLKENEIALLHIPEMHSTFLANKWDMTFVKDDGQSPPIFSEILPARGSGGRELTINGWNARDSRESNKLLDLVQWIERLSGVKTIMQEFYDE